MSDTAISVQGLSKRYVLSHQASSGSGARFAYRRFSDVLIDTFTAPFRRRKGEGAETREDFWALRDISFRIGHGEVVGIIGRNGAGKSTLLKVLSRIIEPTQGRIEIQGRVAALLEVGTGFHPELTGRENIFLNGAILGMRGREIRSKFDEIVAFAEVERFVDTPVKRYSSGMYLRLAFAVAAHLEPEILVVDEVLAVGDLAFQNRCLKKMEDVSGQGRTVLFVSHNMSAIQRLCPRTILLNQGQVVTEGPTSEVIKTYVAQGMTDLPEHVLPHDPLKPIHLRSARLTNADDELANEFRFDEGFRVSVEYEVNETTTSCNVWVSVVTAEEVTVLCTADIDSDPSLLQKRTPGTYRAVLRLPPAWLNAGRYYIVVGIANSAYRVSYDRIEFASFTVLEVGAPERGRPGVLQPFIPWDTSPTDRSAPPAGARAVA